MFSLLQQFKNLRRLALIICVVAVLVYPIKADAKSVLPGPEGMSSSVTKTVKPEEGRFEKYKLYLGAGLTLLIVLPMAGLVYKRKRGSKHRELLIFLGW